MSHCSKFDMKFMDKRVLFSAMKNLDMKPENQIWAEYKSSLGKALDFNGTVVGRLLTGCGGDLRIFFTEENGAYVPHVESHKFSAGELEARAAGMIEKLRKEYARCSVDKLRQNILASGQSVTVIAEPETEPVSFIMEIGAGRKLVISLDEGGGVTEEVSGVAGRSCVDLTKAFEAMTAETAERNWTFEYDELVEDQVVQVLNLRR
jgi:hypothetical protein